MRLERAIVNLVSILLRIVSDSSRRRQVQHTATSVKTVALSAKKDKPVDLRCQDARVAQVGRQRQVEGHTVERDAVVAAVHPVHVGEEGDAAHKEGEQYHTAIGLVQPAVLEAELVEETQTKRGGWKEDMEGENILRKHLKILSEMKNIKCFLRVKIARDTLIRHCHDIWVTIQYYFVVQKWVASPL